MIATILLAGRCPVCGYSNRGVQTGTARPGMRQLRMQPGSLVWVPPACQECRHPMVDALYDRWALDADTTARLRAWQERQRARRRARTGLEPSLGASGRAEHGRSVWGRFRDPLS